MKIKYNKLVRDKIPEIIRGRGETPVFYIAEAGEYEDRLFKKLEEEVGEFLGDNSVEELADILEVIYAICDFKGISVEELEETRKKKAGERGGFSHRIILDGVM